MKKMALLLAVIFGANLAASSLALSVKIEDEGLRKYNKIRRNPLNRRALKLKAPAGAIPIMAER